jgi:hypothetical protein
LEQLLIWFNFEDSLQSKGSFRSVSFHQPSLSRQAVKYLVGCRCLSVSTWSLPSEAESVS